MTYCCWFFGVSFWWLLDKFKAEKNRSQPVCWSASWDIISLGEYLVKFAKLGPVCWLASQVALFVQQIIWLSPGKRGSDRSLGLWSVHPETGEDQYNKFRYILKSWITASDPLCWIQALLISIKSDTEVVYIVNKGNFLSSWSCKNLDRRTLGCSFLWV